jgi:hypothetical protein
MPAILTNVDNPLGNPVDKCVVRKQRKSIVARTEGGEYRGSLKRKNGAMAFLVRFGGMGFYPVFSPLAWVLLGASP